MGQMRFRLANRDRISPGGLERIYVAGIEEIPWLTRCSWEGEQLVVERTIDDSGCVFVPWTIEGRGPCLLSTATLMEREAPYVLDVELARGLVHQIRNRLFLWEWLGLETPKNLRDDLQAATREFSRAATNQANLAECCVSANQAIARALEVSEKLVAAYAGQALSSRQQQTPASTLMGVTLGPKLPSVEVRRKLVEACNLIQLPMAWRSVEVSEGRRNWKQTDEQLAWCQKAGLKVAAGPLLQMDNHGIPDWMVLWDGDFEHLMQMVLDHVRAVVSRYAGRVHLWNVASRVNVGKMLSLEEDQRLHLVAHVIETVQRADSRTPIVVTFDQPWGEYLSGKESDLAPISYADALVRADLGISGFGLEINTGFRPGGSAHRPTFEFGRLLDQWSIWGMPLMVTLSTASSTEYDPKARKNIEVDLPAMFGTNTGDPQHDWAAAVLPLMLARSAVQVVVWNQLEDSESHEFPHAGLFDAQHQPKPVVDLMRDLRKSLL